MKTVYLVNDKEKIEEIDFYNMELIAAMKYAEKCFIKLSEILGDDELQYNGEKVKYIREEMEEKIKKYD